MTARRRSCRPRLEALEGRDTPANLTVTFSALTHTLTIVGDSSNNALTVQGDAADPTRFHLSSTTDTFNHSPGPLDTPGGVRNIAVWLLDGDDHVTFDNAVPIDLRGSLSVNGGNGANSVVTTDLKVEKNFSITNGTNASGSDINTIDNVTVGGSLTINNGAGDTAMDIRRDTAGVSAVGGSLSITNGPGTDSNIIADLNVGGSVTVNNGRANPQTGSAGYTVIGNQIHNDFRSQIRGNVSVSYLDGNVNGSDGIFDADIDGNVTFNHGTGSAVTRFDGYATSLPVVIRGSLTFKGSGANTVSVGKAFDYTGLVVGKNLTVTTGAAADTLVFNQLEVGGATRLSLGDGGNAVAIDDSLFAGAFTLTTGAGNDQVSLDATASGAEPTTFGGPVLIAQGAGDDQVVRAGPDAPEELIVLSTFVIHHGTGAGDSTTATPGHEIFPFGTSIQYVV
ncbi:MAG: hypothetical protein J2P46_13935 [Zavarzinella sp.]|nr:hypothetical protein [Zavarzinella sp.]